MARYTDLIKLTEGEENVITALAQNGSTAIDQFWLLTCCSLRRKGLVSIYSRTVRVFDEPEGKAFICLTPLGWEVAEEIQAHKPISGMAD